MNEIIKKIDEEIEKCRISNMTSPTIKFVNIAKGLVIAKEIILSSQKDPVQACKAKDTTCLGYKDGECHSIENCHAKVEQSEQKEPCEWILDDDEANAWECSKCNAVWILDAGTPQENNMRFCPECGSPIN